MRIVIISHHRCGSTTLSRWLSLELGYSLIMEPYHPSSLLNKNRELNIKNALEVDNVVVKYLYHQFNNEIEIDEVLNKFDKILLLTRQDEKESDISAVYARINKKYHNYYSIDDAWIDSNIDEINDEIKNIKYSKNEINKIAVGLNINYENIFIKKEDIEKIKKYIGINEFKFDNSYLLDKINRYRNNTYKKLL